MEQARLNYQTTAYVDLDVLRVRGASEPDGITKFPDLRFEFLDGTLAEMIKGGRREISIDFQVMTALQRRKVVDWWLDEDKTIECIASTPGKPSKSGSASGTLNGSFFYKISCVDPIGETACGVVSDQIDLAVEGCPLTWTASAWARCYKIYRSDDAQATWDLIDYSTTNTYTDTGAAAYREEVTPPAAGTVIDVVGEGDLRFEWGQGTELVRFLTVEVREKTIFTKEDGFPI